MAPPVRASSSSPKRGQGDAAAEDDVIALARRVELAVVLQTDTRPSGLDAETEQKAAAHICRAFPACFGLKDATPRTLNEVAFLMVRNLTQKAEQRRIETKRNPTQTRVNFRSAASDLRNTWPSYTQQRPSMPSILRRPPSALPSPMVSVESESQE